MNGNPTISFLTTKDPSEDFKYFFFYPLARRKEGGGGDGLGLNGGRKLV